MQSKVSVTLIKSRAVNNSSDLNKMAVHLEQILAEKDGVELKVRQGLTDALIKTTSFVVFCGYDCATLSELFKVLSFSESADGPVVFLYEEPGQSVWERLNYILRDGVDLRRMDPKIFHKIVDTWSYRDIIATIDVELRKLGTGSTTGSDSPAK
jgi:hypothetical protein